MRGALRRDRARRHLRAAVRPLFIYVNNASYSEKPQVAEFVDYYVTNDAEIAELAQFIPLNEEQTTELQTQAASLAG